LAPSLFELRTLKENRRQKIGWQKTEGKRSKPQIGDQRKPTAIDRQLTAHSQRRMAILYVSTTPLLHSLEEAEAKAEAEEE
jgi:hypothetical protein